MRILIITLLALLVSFTNASDVCTPCSCPESFEQCVPISGTTFQLCGQCACSETHFYGFVDQGSTDCNDPACCQSAEVTANGELTPRTPATTQAVDENLNQPVQEETLSSSDVCTACSCPDSLDMCIPIGGTDFRLCDNQCACSETHFYGFVDQGTTDCNEPSCCEAAEVAANGELTPRTSTESTAAAVDENMGEPDQVETLASPDVCTVCSCPDSLDTCVPISGTGFRLCDNQCACSETHFYGFVDQGTTDCNDPSCCEAAEIAANGDLTPRTTESTAAAVDENMGEPVQVESLALPDFCTPCSCPDSLDMCIPITGTGFRLCDNQCACSENFFYGFVDQGTTECNDPDCCQTAAVDAFGALTPRTTTEPTSAVDDNIVAEDPQQEATLAPLETAAPTTAQTTSLPQQEVRTTQAAQVDTTQAVQNEEAVPETQAPTTAPQVEQPDDISVISDSDDGRDDAAATDNQAQSETPSSSGGGCSLGVWCWLAPLIGLCVTAVALIFCVVYARRRRKRLREQELQYNDLHVVNFA